MGEGGHLGAAARACGAVASREYIVLGGQGVAEVGTVLRGSGCEWVGWGGVVMVGGGGAVMGRYVRAAAGAYAAVTDSLM